MRQIQRFIKVTSVVFIIGIAQLSYAQSGVELYKTYCAACHGLAGEGDLRWPDLNEAGDMTAPPHGENGHTWRHSDKDLLTITLNGHRDPYNTTDTLTMPAYNGVLTSEQVYKVIDHIKSWWTLDQIEFQKKLNK